MRDLLAEATGNDERTDDVNARFTKAAARLNRLLSDLKKSPLRSVLAIVGKSDATIAFIPARRDSAQETSAKAALVKLASDSKSRIEHIADGADRSSLSVPRFEVMSREEASFAYIKSFIEYPIICLTVDLLVPLAGLIVLVFFAPGRASDQPVASKSDRTSETVPDDATAVRRPGDNAQRIVDVLRRHDRPATAPDRSEDGAAARPSNGATHAANGRSS